MGGASTAADRVKIMVHHLLLVALPPASSSSSSFSLQVPENHHRFPEHYSLAKQVLYSPRLLKRIRHAVAGRNAYIVPGEVGPEDLQLAVELGLPLLGPDPDAAAFFGSKSGNKRIFASAQVPVPIGAHDIYDERDFYAYFAKLIVDHLGE